MNIVEKHIFSSLNSDSEAFKNLTFIRLIFYYSNSYILKLTPFNPWINLPNLHTTIPYRLFTSVQRWQSLWSVFSAFCFNQVEPRIWHLVLVFLQRDQQNLYFTILNTQITIRCFSIELISLSFSFLMLHGRNASTGSTQPLPSFWIMTRIILMQIILL